MQKMSKISSTSPTQESVSNIHSARRTKKTRNEDMEGRRRMEKLSIHTDSTSRNDNARDVEMGENIKNVEMTRKSNSPTQALMYDSSSPRRLKNSCISETTEKTKEEEVPSSTTHILTNDRLNENRCDVYIAEDISRLSISPVQASVNDNPSTRQKEGAWVVTIDESSPGNNSDFNIRYPNMKMICKTCGEIGHLALGCLNPPKIVCYHCGMAKLHSGVTEHAQEKSGESSDFITRYPKMKMKCKNCGERGHMSIGCLNQRRQVCYQCGAVMSHSTEECDFISTEDGAQILKPLFPCSLKYVIFPVNKFPTTWLIDSGAAMSFIKDVIAKELKLPRYKADAAIEYTDISGAAMNEHGVAEIQFKFGDTQITHNYVIGGNELKFQSDGILGIDFLHRFKCVIDYGRNRLKLCGYSIEMDDEDRIVSKQWVTHKSKQQKDVRLPKPNIR